MHDVLTNCDVTRINCLDQGFVTLVDAMPRLVPDERKTADFAITQAARVSYGDGTKSVNEDRGLIRYLMRHTHTTPFEMVEFKFHCKMPIFVARQWIRHRTANVNEYSGRYSIMKDEFYKPDLDNVRQQSKSNKQGGEQPMETMEAQDFLNNLESLCNKAYSEYMRAADNGVAREQARMTLPMNLYTEWYWKIDLHNLFHFLGLRCDAHAQWEIRVFADAMLALIEPIVPMAVEAWNDYHDHRGAMKMTRLEIDALREYIVQLQRVANEVVEDFQGNRNFSIAMPKLAGDNKREQEEWVAKATKLGLKEV